MNGDKIKLTSLFFIAIILLIILSISRGAQQPLLKIDDKLYTMVYSTEEIPSFLSKIDTIKYNEEIININSKNNSSNYLSVDTKIFIDDSGNIISYDKNLFTAWEELGYE
ncbi:MAG: hypothetical protein SOZ40_06440 [Ezakiella sp.]|nr:hypothetical protein [Ezakiella sp.]MDY3947601.1 hypothetical protein [Ezakiella sp.]